MARPLDPHYAEQVMRQARFEPLLPYPGARARWLCRCLDCDAWCTPTYDAVRSKGHQCGCHQPRDQWQPPPSQARLDPHQAEQAMLEAGWRPVAAYPGTRAPWPSVCTACGAPGRPRHQDVRMGRCRCHCRARSRRRPRLDPQRAQEVMLAAGYRPTAPFPGSRPPWPSVCTACGAARSPRYFIVRRGHRCPCRRATPTPKETDHERHP